MREGDAAHYRAQFVMADKSFGFAKVGRNVKIHTQAIIPNPGSVEFGDNVRIDAFTILSAHRIVVGDFVHIGAHCVLSGRDKIEFEDFSSMSHHSQIFTSTDDLNIPALTNTTVPIDLQALINAPVIIEKHAIVGANTIVMPGVTLGMGSVAGAMSLVKDSVRPYQIVGGIPAKVIRERFRQITPEALARLEEKCRRES